MTKERTLREAVEKLPRYTAKFLAEYGGGATPREYVALDEVVSLLSTAQPVAPDKNCITLPNGDCVGKGCMHDIAQIEANMPRGYEWQEKCCHVDVDPSKGAVYCKYCKSVVAESSQLGPASLEKAVAQARLEEHDLTCAYCRWNKDENDRCDRGAALQRVAAEGGTK